MSIPAPRCSCIVCHKEQSSKGIYSHYLTAHTKEGNARVKLNAKIRNKIKTKSQEKAERLRIEYSNNPNLCLQCKKPLLYKARHGKYCSNSCSAISTNSYRDKECYLKQSETLKENLNKRPKFSKIKFKECKNCNKSYVFSRYNESTPSFCSNECSKIYKSEAMKKLNNKHHFGGVRKSRQIVYNGIHLGSSYEVKLAKILDELNIDWVKPKRISYMVNNKIKTYTADFYLPKYDLYLDPKNDFLINNVNPGSGFKDLDKIAWVVEQNSIIVAIIDYDNIISNTITKLVEQAGFEPAIILSCKESGFDHSHHCSIRYIH